MNLKLGEDEIISMSHSLFSEGLDGVEGGGGGTDRSVSNLLSSNL